MGLLLHKVARGGTPVSANPPGKSLLGTP